MDEENFGFLRVSNSTSLCVGGITSAEANQAKEWGMEIDGFGYYLFLSSEAEPTESIEILLIHESHPAMSARYGMGWIRAAL